MENKQKQIEEMAKDRCTELRLMYEFCKYNGCEPKTYDDCENCYFRKVYERLAELEEKIRNGTLKEIPENAVVMTDKELNEELDAIKCVMIVHDDDGERYVSYDDYKEFTGRLGKLARQRKVRIEQLEKLLDDRCDRCIETVRKETAEKFADKINTVINNRKKSVGMNDYVVDAERMIFEVNQIHKEFANEAAK